MANYIDNKRFEYLIVEYCSGHKEQHEVELFDLFNLLIDNIITSFKFNVDPDDAKQECFVLILRILNKFEKDRGNAFAFFTTAIMNQLRLLYSKDKTYRLKLETYYDKNNHLRDLLDE